MPQNGASGRISLASGGEKPEFGDIRLRAELGLGDGAVQRGQLQHPDPPSLSRLWCDSPVLLEITDFWRQGCPDHFTSFLQPVGASARLPPKALCVLPQRSLTLA